MTPHCLCEQCKMTVLQCKERASHSNSTSAEQVLGELLKCPGVERVAGKSGRFWYSHTDFGDIITLHILDAELREARR